MCFGIVTMLMIPFFLTCNFFHISVIFTCEFYMIYLFLCDLFFFMIQLILYTMFHTWLTHFHVCFFQMIICFLMIYSTLFKTWCLISSLIIHMMPCAYCSQAMAWHNMFYIVTFMYLWKKLSSWCEKFFSPLLLFLMNICFLHLT